MKQRIKTTVCLVIKACRKHSPFRNDFSYSDKKTSKIFSRLNTNILRQRHFKRHTNNEDWN